VDRETRSSILPIRTRCRFSSVAERGPPKPDVDCSIQSAGANFFSCLGGPLASLQNATVVRWYEAKVVVRHWRLRQRLKVLLREFAKRIGDGAGRAERDRPISDCVAPEAIADQIHGAVGRPARHPSLGARPALFIPQPEWELKLNVPAGLEVRHGDRQQ
jgi:hypothetical protein